MTLSNPSGSVQITSPTASGTILNDDIALAIAATDAVKPEGNTGNTAFTLTVTRTGLTTGTTTVNYAVTGTGPNPANAADFGGTLPSGMVSFAAGETSKTITVNVSGDTDGRAGRRLFRHAVQRLGRCPDHHRNGRRHDPERRHGAGDCRRRCGQTGRERRQHAVHLHGDANGPDDGNDDRELPGCRHGSQSGRDISAARCPAGW